MAGVVSAVPWATAPDAVAASQHRALDSIFNTQIIFGRAGRTDDISGYYDMDGYKSTMPKHMSVSGDNYSRFQGSGMAETNYGGGNTPSNPGGYNWRTLENNLNRASVGFRTSRELRKQMKANAATQAEERLNYLSPANAQSTAPAMTYLQAQKVAATIHKAAKKNPYAPGLSLEQAQKLADDIKTQYFGVGPVRKQSRNPAVQQPKKKSTAPKINSPKSPGA